ncbi:MAG: DUF2188 domain-containing protein [Nitrospirae bacterium]|nr:DUF2188 domain-containing protein [Nitrospirota bacterium]
MSKNQWIVRYGKGWAVRGEGNSRVTKAFEKQSDAIGLGREISERHRSELIIQARDGTIRQKDSHGRDPYPPAG